MQPEEVHLLVQGGLVIDQLLRVGLGLANFLGSRGSHDVDVEIYLHVSVLRLSRLDVYQFDGSILTGC